MKRSKTPNSSKEPQKAANDLRNTSWADSFAQQVAKARPSVRRRRLHSPSVPFSSAPCSSFASQASATPQLTPPPRHAFVQEVTEQLAVGVEVSPTAQSGQTRRLRQTLEPKDIQGPSKLFEDLRGSFSEQLLEFCLEFHCKALNIS